MKLVPPDEAVAAVSSGDTLTFCGSAGVGVPSLLFEALARRFDASGEPRDLTLFFPVESGGARGDGMDKLARTGMLKRLVGGAFIFTGSKEPADTVRLIQSGEVEGYNLPMGVMFHLFREAAAGRPGLLTRVGLGTFVDPLYSGAKLNSRTQEDIVKRVTVDGETYLFYPAPRFDVAFIRGTVADEDGNISMEEEASLLGCLSQAMAAKASGGVVVAQVKRLVRRGSLRAKDVRIPGMLVDLLVVDPRQEQIQGVDRDPAVSGEARVSAFPPSLGEAPLAARIVARRAARELPDGALVNVGFGMGALVPRVIAAERPEAAIRFLVEQGAVGGVPLSGLMFGVAQNPEAFLEMPSWFDFIDGGNFSATCLGLGEVDGEGNVNNHWIGNVLTGCGGFIDITSRAPHVIFCGTLTSGGLRVEVRDGRLHVLQEGKYRKLVPTVPQPTFNGRDARNRRQRMTVVTERAVFELRSEGLTLVEVAPGVSVDQVAALAGFSLKVAERLREMPAEIFI